MRFIAIVYLLPLSIAVTVSNNSHRDPTILVPYEPHINTTSSSSSLTQSARPFLTPEPEEEEEQLDVPAPDPTTTLTASYTTLPPYTPETTSTTSTVSAISDPTPARLARTASCSGEPPAASTGPSRTTVLEPRISPVLLDMFSAFPMSSPNAEKKGALGNIPVMSFSSRTSSSATVPTVPIVAVDVFNAFPMSSPDAEKATLTRSLIMSFSSRTFDSGDGMSASATPLARYSARYSAIPSGRLPARPSATPLASVSAIYAAGAFLEQGQTTSAPASRRVQASKPSGSARLSRYVQRPTPLAVSDVDMAGKGDMAAERESTMATVIARVQRSMTTAAQHTLSEY